LIANIVRLYRGEALDLKVVGAGEMAAKLKEVFSPLPHAGEGPGERVLRYADVPGVDMSDEDFNGQLETLNAPALELQHRIAQNVVSLLS
jgi:hypothetical protein